MRTFQDGRPVEHSIGEIGFDITRHSQLAYGLGMAATEASTQKTSIGLAACLMFHKHAGQERIKAKWINPIEEHLKGLPNKDAIARGIMMHDTNAQRINSVLGDVLLLLGDRRKHRFHPLPFMIYKAIQRNGTAAAPGDFTRDNLHKIDFSGEAFIADCMALVVQVPREVSEQVKSVLAISMLGAQYEDMGILQFMLGFQPLKRSDCQAVFKAIRTPYAMSANVSLPMLYTSRMRKALGYELSLAGEGQWSSEPAFKGSRKRKVDDLKEKLKKSDSTYQSMGDVVDKLLKLKTYIEEKLTDETQFGQAQWFNVHTRAFENAVPRETGGYWFGQNIM